MPIDNETLNQLTYQLSDIQSELESLREQNTPGKSQAFLQNLTRKIANLDQQQQAIQFILINQSKRTEYDFKFSYFLVRFLNSLYPTGFVHINQIYGDR